MCTLYAYAGHNGYLVAGTGNKIEDFGVGFFTKWADGAVDLSPIGDLSKSQVWELARFLGVHDDIIKAIPTDGLWEDNRGDEDAIGASYPELEWAMAEAETKKINAGDWPATVRNWEMGGSTGPYTKREIEVMTIYLQRHTATRHKINPIPVCPIPAVLL
jgi:NAD+ synthase